MEESARSLARLGTKREGSRDLRQLRRLAAYLRPYRGHVLGALLALVLASAAVLSLGIGLRYLVDGGFRDLRVGASDHADVATITR